MLESTRDLFKLCFTFLFASGSFNVEEGTEHCRTLKQLFGKKLLDEYMKVLDDETQFLESMKCYKMGHKSKAWQFQQIDIGSLFIVCQIMRTIPYTAFLKHLWWRCVRHLMGWWRMTRRWVNVFSESLVREPHAWTGAAWVQEKSSLVKAAYHSHVG